MVAILGANSVSGGYEVSNSLRFNDGDSPQLNLQNVGTVSNDKKFTFSTWLKRSDIGTANYSILSADSGNNKAQILFRGGSNNAIRILETSDAFSSFDTLLTTDAVYRDPSAWYNIIISYDSTDSTAGDRVKIYSNGVLQTLTGTTANLNHTTPFNEASYNLDIGHFGGSSGEFFDGYITETHFIDGTAKAPTDFGEFDDNGVWVPIKYTGSYGNNGFFLEFKQTGTGTDASGIGADTSGNNRHWAVTNLAATDITEDTCTNNFATFNPLARNASNVYTEGNTVYDYTGNFMRCGVSSLGVSSGKWYAEFKRTDATTIHLFGIVADNFVSDGRTVTDTSGNHDYGRGHTGTLFLFSTNSTQDIYLDGSDTNTNVDFTTTTNDIIMIAFDADSKKIWFGKNGTWSSSGDPANGNNPSDTYDGTGTEPFFFSVGTEGTQAIQGNFGNPPFAISSGNTDGKYGNFEYAPPSGYYALCTKRLAEFG